MKAPNGQNANPAAKRRVAKRHVENNHVANNHAATPAANHEARCPGRAHRSRVAMRKNEELIVCAFGKIFRSAF